MNTDIHCNEQRAPEGNVYLQIMQILCLTAVYGFILVIAHIILIMR